MRRTQATLIVAFGLSQLVAAAPRTGIAGTEDREVIVMFRPGIIQLPAGVDSGTVDQANISTIVVDDLLSTSGVELVSKAFPDFSLTDTLGTNLYGDTVRLTNWSNVYTLRLPVGSPPESLAGALQGMDGVAFAEANGSASFSAPLYPNDPHFVNGSQWGLRNYGQGSPAGTVDVDIDAPEAWGAPAGAPTGATWFKIGLIDAGVSATHPDLQGQVIGDFGNDDNGHGSLMAGTIGARTSNGEGIAGVNWNTLLVSKNIYGAGEVGVSQRLTDAFNEGAKVFNLSWAWTARGTFCTPLFPFTIRLKLADLYKLGCPVIAGTHNCGDSTKHFPAAFGQGVIAVGATNKTDARWINSNYGSHMDISAPGEAIISTDDVGYRTDSGTSFSTAYVSGIASLIESVAPATLFIGHDDVENLLRLSADDISPSGYDVLTGWGRANAQRAVQLVRAPNVMRPVTRVFGGGVQVGPVVNIPAMRFHNVLGLDPSITYEARRYDVQRLVPFTPAFGRIPQVWGVGGSDLEGFSADNPNFGLGWCEPVGTIGVDGCTMRTYVYEVWQDGVWRRYPSVTLSGGQYGVEYIARALEVAGRPDPAQSFYVPQRGSVGTPIEGASAVAFLRACPNNDGDASLPNNVRVKIVARDSAGAGIAGISPADIFVLFNGGTPLQGFIGDGADSVISDSTYNRSPLCPVLRALNADAPTDGSGATYITFAGSTPGQPGVATRDPGRKWGHFDSALPVYVLGVPLQGRLTTASANGSYVLQIKNFDFTTTAGLNTEMDKGEAVTSSDFSGVVNHLGHSPADHPLDWWADFNSDGVISSADQQMMFNHVTHDCDFPNNP